MSWFYYIFINFERFFLKLKGLSDGKVISLTQKEYFFAVHFLQIFIKSLKSISDEWFISICWSSPLFGIFIIKECVQFSLTSSGTLNYDCVIKRSEMLSFRPLINISFSTGLSLSLLIISAIISSKTINSSRIFLGYSSIFLY